MALKARWTAEWEDLLNKVALQGHEVEVCLETPKHAVTLRNLFNNLKRHLAASPGLEAQHALANTVVCLVRGHFVVFQPESGTWYSRAIRLALDKEQTDADARQGTNEGREGAMGLEHPGPSSSEGGT